MTQLPKTTATINELANGWLTIWFNTPDNRNALTTELSADLRATLRAVHDDRRVRGITLRGKGGTFCAGGDLKSFSSGFHKGAALHEDVAATNRAGGVMFAQINSMPQVVVALIEGAAIAGGLGIACCCDVVAVTKDAKFALTETQIGIAPAQIAPYVVQRVGLTNARRLMLTGARFNGEQSAFLGIADFVANDTVGLEAVEADIKTGVMRCAPGANAATKEIVLATPHLSPAEMREFAAKRFADCMLSDEGVEGISSFVEKRKPNWAK